MLINVLLLSVSIASIGLGLIIFLRNTKNNANFYYGLFSMFLAVWAFGMWMYAKDPINFNRILVWSKVLHFAGISVAVNLLLFSFAFTANKLLSKIYIRIIILTPIILLFWLTLFTNKVISSVNFLPDNRQLIYGPLYFIYFGIFVLYMLLALIILTKKYFASSGILKQQLKYICLGIGIPSSIALVINMVLPALGNFRIAWSGPVVIFVVIASIGYAITKHHLFEIKVIVSEVSVTLLFFAALFDLLTSKTPGEIAIRLIALIIVIFGGILLIKSIQHEIKQRQDLEVLAKKLDEANQHLEELDEAKDNFLSMASHELNTPIAAIMGYLSMIIEEKKCGKLDPQLAKYLNTIFASSQRLAGLVKDLLNVSRIESNRIHIIYSEAQIEDVIEQSIAEVAIKAKEVGHKLTFEKPSKSLPKTWLDVPRIVEVMINLIGNAIKYTEPPGKIEVACHADDDRIIVSVEDNGRGIPKDKYDHVFEKFTQVNVLTDQVKGTGLGMFISKNLIAMHKGKLWFKSSVDKDDHGTTFYFSLPILKDKPFDPHEGEGALFQTGKPKTTTEATTSITAAEVKCEIDKANGKELSSKDCKDKTDTKTEDKPRVDDPTLQKLRGTGKTVTPIPTKDSPATTPSAETSADSKAKV
ncbi:MAG: ATP-binding protein [Patescibacteria group bacterium]|nr:ATP-binding protein [Patescibacteria group bacterium]